MSYEAYSASFAPQRSSALVHREGGIERRTAQRPPGVGLRDLERRGGGWQGLPFLCPSPGLDSVDWRVVSRLTSQRRRFHSPRALIRCAAIANRLDG